MNLTTAFTSYREAAWSWLRTHRGALLELALIFLFAVWLAGSLLQPISGPVNGGREWGVSVHTHHVWTAFRQCGTCALWNGSMLGGYPALLDVHTAPFHPLVALSTLLFGVNQGARVALFIALYLAGVGQWWLAHQFSLGRVTRLWAAAIGISGGYILGRLELGAFMVPFAVAMTSLLVPAALNVFRKRNMRAAIVLGALLASALLSGSGYMQVGLAISLIAFLFLILAPAKLHIEPTLKFLAIGAGFGVLLASFWLLPVASDFSVLAKNQNAITIVEHPFDLLFLNLVSVDPALYQNVELGLPGHPYLFVQFVGWSTVLTAVLGLFLSGRAPTRVKLFAISSVALIYLAAAGHVFAWLAKFIPLAFWVRNHSQMASMAVPFIIFLSALGVDYLARFETGIDLSVTVNGRTLWAPINLLIVIPLVLTVLHAASIVRPWIHFLDFDENIQQSIAFAQESQRSEESLAWVQTPFGAHYWDEIAIGGGLKLSTVLQSILLDGREYPPARYVLSDTPIDETGAELVGEFGNNRVLRFPDVHYAFVTTPDGTIVPCQSSGTGGHIDVTCDTDTGGRLLVYEHMWNGWTARVHGGRTPLVGQEWLELDLKPGKQAIELRYQPWEPWAGLLLSLGGVALSVWLWRRDGQAVEQRPLEADAGIPAVQ